MKIGIDARFYGLSGKGIGRYLEKLIAHLEKLDQKNEYFIFLRRENFDLYQTTNPHFHKVLADYPWYSWQEQILLPLKLKKYRLDLVHFPHFNVPIFYSGKFILTVHDLTLLDWPTKHQGLYNLFYKIKDLIFRLILHRALQKAAKIITDSEFTKQELIKKFKIPSEKIEIIYLAG
ncbi:MAG: glycosyltransferase [Patescibacteria group bacterium]